MGVTSISGNALYLVCSDASVQMHNPVPSIWGKEPWAEETQQCRFAGKKKKKASKKQGMFLLVLYPQMRSFLPHQLTGRQGGETGLSGCIEDFFFPFGPVVLTGSQKTALRAIR